ncbi:transcription factor bHLH111-like isoform X2 [Iris pallida]|uniref:Transcription factor bHLH111-like isoform X2 n=1 Tax=Iris pallida TaxID=29817 RepID=A0AAX6HH04_IRIPA|nr:transcription factor bHLH111-like isoform X2 [Iris pallida]
MAQEGSEASVASSSPVPNWWEMHANPISSWNAINRWQQPQSNVVVSSDCNEQDISISAANSGLSMDSSSADLSGEPPENHLWNQVLFAGRSGGDLHGGHDGGGSFLEGLSSKSLQAAEMFDPACDYLKKLDSSWEFTNHLPVLNSLEKQLSGYSGGTIIEPERMTNLSDLVSNWSIAPPNPACSSVSLNPSMAHPYSMSNISQIKHEIPSNMQSYPDMGCYQDPLVSVSVSEPSLLKPIRSDHIGYQVGGLNDSFMGPNKYCGGMTDAPWSSNARNLSDLISFGSSLSKPAMEFRATRPSVKGISSESSGSKKQAYETSSSTKGSGRNSGTSEGKKKRSEDSSETLFKKSKHESSNASPLKLQAPKVKLADRITALQQIVSPFGKTDTASVLLEAINCIRSLQEQVQLLSDPYMKSSSNKDHNPWGALERKDKTDLKLDLESRGLCLVPISCTPQIYRENTGPDYWTPTYRGCLYR